MIIDMFQVCVDVQENIIYWYDWKTNSDINDPVQANDINE